MNWPEVKFGELFRIKHGFAFKSQYFDSSGPYVLMTPGNFKEEGGFRDQGEKTKFYNGDVPDGYVLDEGDLLVAMTEQTTGLLGSSAWIPESNRLLHNQRLGRVVDLDESRVNKRFLYYLFNTREVRGQISGSASGTKVRHTAPDRIGQVLVRLPPRPVQEAIASVLSNYDFQIQNNRRRMELLEKGARELYTEWFIRLRFPGFEHTSISDGIPQGWRSVTLGDLSSDVRETVKPADVDPDTPYIGLEHIPRRSVSLSEWGVAEGVTSAKHRFRTNEILFGKIRPYFHKVGLTFTDGIASSDAIVIRPRTEGVLGFVLMTVSSDPFVASTSQSMREGSKMPRADWNLMKQHRVALPPSILLDEFNITIGSITHLLRNLCFQNRALHTAAELLLPRLMRGDIAA